MNDAGASETPEREIIKARIKELFDERVRGRSPEPISGKKHHDGSEGHWLQYQFGLSPENHNAPDLMGFELKDDTTGKTTFGDWPASNYLFVSHEACIENSTKRLKCMKCSNSVMIRDHFLHVFGTATNPKHPNRFSWSGSVFPKVGSTNKYGQGMFVELDHSVRITYSFELDRRPDKTDYVPTDLRGTTMTLAFWSAELLRKRVEQKFNQFGWFKCVQASKGKGEYTHLKFGIPITFERWISEVQRGSVYLDSGMYQGNKRPYSNWRANNDFWDTLVEETYY